MPYTLLAALLLSPASSAAPAVSVAETITPVAEIWQDKKKYDHQWLCLVGKASELDVEISPVRHHKYWTAKLHDNESAIVLFAYGEPPFKGGDVIEACGIYARLKKAQSTGEIFHDEFNVTNVLQGPSMKAGRVVITPNGIVAANGPAPRYADPSQPFGGGAPAPSKKP